VLPALEDSEEPCFHAYPNGVSLGPAAPAASDPAGFYKGKTVTYVVAATAGGNYDVYGRLSRPA